MTDNILKDKKLLILAGADVHTKVVKAAKELGIKTIVTDYLNPKDAPAKQVADEYWVIDINDVDEIAKRCRKESIDGVLAFCIDPAQIPYSKVCKELNLPCFGTLEQFKTFTNKRLFKDFCKRHGVGIIPEYDYEDIIKDNVKYPVLVKPTDSRGSRGLTICNSKNEVDNAIDIAKKESHDGGFIIERYMKYADDMSFSYIVIDSHPWLLKIGDRFLGKQEDNLDRQQIATLLPSKHSEEYIKKVHPRVCAMIKALGIEFGAIFLQGFWEDGEVYMYDPGMRFPGSDFDVVLKKSTGFDNMKSMVRFALTGDKESCFGNPQDAYKLKNSYCLILSIAVHPGKIQKIRGLDAVSNHEYTLSASLRQKEGDIVPDSGDVRQRMAEFVAHIPNIDEVKKYLEFIYRNFKVLDSNGEDMIISKIEI